MKVFAKFKRIQGNQLTVELEEETSIRRIGTLSDGSTPIVEINIQDARKITTKQRAFIFALCRDIDEWSGYDRGYSREYFRDLYEEYYCVDRFSLAECSEEDATIFIDLIIDFVLHHHVPLPKGIQVLPANQNQYFYSCLKYRICCISGKANAQIAHFEAVGNRKRSRVDHRQFHFMALSARYHSEQHNIGITEFCKKYHVVPIKLDEETILKLGLMSRKQMIELDRM